MSFSYTDIYKKPQIPSCIISMNACIFLHGLRAYEWAGPIYMVLYTF